MERMRTANLDAALAWAGLEVFDREGERIGRLTAIYLDVEHETPEFGLVRIGLFGLRYVLVPLSGAFEEAGVLIVDLDKSSTKGAPHLRREEPLPPEMENQLYSHYGIEPPETADGSPRLVVWRLEDHE
jgi:hypothetical protein